MADPSIRSYTIQVYGTGNPYNVTKPTGLTVGDLMVLMVTSGNAYPSGGPSNWAKIRESAAQDHRVTIWAKIADAADAAASHFSVPNAGGLYLYATLWAVIDAGATIYHASAYVASGQYAEVAGYTSTTANSLILMVYECEQQPDTFLVLNGNTTDYTPDTSWWIARAGHCSLAVLTSGYIRGRWGASAKGVLGVLAIDSTAPSKNNIAVATAQPTQITAIDSLYRSRGRISLKRVAADEWFTRTSFDLVTGSDNGDMRRGDPGLMSISGRVDMMEEDE